MAANIDPYIEIIKNGVGGDQVRDAIIHCMEEINKESAYEVREFFKKGKVSELNNGSPYYAPTGVVYKSVTLQLEDDSGEDLPPTTRQTYDFEVNNQTENRTYNAEEEHGAGAAWGDITVNLDFASIYGDNNISDNEVISTEDLDDSGTFHAENRGLYAMQSITFSDIDPVAKKGGYVGPGGVGYFPITFVDTDGSKIGQADIPSGSPITYSISQEVQSKHPGMTFMGWSGSSVATKAETVVAQWGNPSISIEEIQQDWDWIAKYNGSIPLGAFKSIVVSVDIPNAVDKATFPEIPESVLPSQGSYHYALTAYAMKVANGEKGTHSSWLTCIPSISYTKDERTYNTLVPNHIIDAVDTHLDAPHNKWSNTAARRWLNGTFLTAVLPKNLTPYIIKAEKSFKARTETNDLITESVYDYVWAPSAKELFMLGHDDQASEVGSAAWDENTVDAYITNGSGMDYMTLLFGTDGSNRGKWFTKLVASSGNNFVSGHIRDNLWFYGSGGSSNAYPNGVRIEKNDNTYTSYMDSLYNAVYNFKCTPAVFGFCL